MICVTELEGKKSRGIQRYRFTSHRTYSLNVIAFDPPTRTEHGVRFLDISVVGVGIASSERIGPGLVYFREPVGGQKFGVVVWSKPNDDHYRAGIQFVILPPEKEAYIQEQVKQSHPRKLLSDPDKIIASLLESIKNGTHG
jgi:hypothetical protein